MFSDKNNVSPPTSFHIFLLKENNNIFLKEREVFSFLFLILLLKILDLIESKLTE